MTTDADANDSPPTEGGDGDDTPTASFTPAAIRQRLPSDLSDDYQRALICAVRNPDAAYREIGRATNLDHTVVRNALEALVKGLAGPGNQDAGWIEERGGATDAKAFVELTDKQQAVIDFLAHHPDFDWQRRTGRELDNAIQDWDQDTAAMHYTYPKGVAEKYADLIEDRRETLLAAGVELNGEIDQDVLDWNPTTPRGWFDAAGITNLPNTNMDHLDTAEQRLRDTGGPRDMGDADTDTDAAAEAAEAAGDAEATHDDGPRTDDAAASGDAADTEGDTTTEVGKPLSDPSDADTGDHETVEVRADVFGELTERLAAQERTIERLEAKVEENSEALPGPDMARQLNEAAETVLGAEPQLSALSGRVDTVEDRINDLADDVEHQIDVAADGVLMVVADVDRRVDRLADHVDAVDDDLETAIDHLGTVESDMIDLMDRVDEATERAADVETAAERDINDLSDRVDALEAAQDRAGTDDVTLVDAIETLERAGVAYEITATNDPTTDDTTDTTNDHD